MPVYLVKVISVDQLKQRQHEIVGEELAEIGNWEVDFSRGKIHLDETLGKMRGSSAAMNFSLKEGEMLLVEKAARIKVRKLAHDAAVYGIPWSEELLLTPKKNVKRWVLCQCMPVFKIGTCVGLRGTVQDIDVFKRVEQDFKEQNAQLKILFENMDHLVTIRDKQMRLLYCNSNVNRIFGFDKDVFAGMQIKDLVYSEDQEKTLAILKEVRRSGNVSDFQNRVITKSGGVKEISWDLTWFAEGEKLYAVGKDITHLKKTKRHFEGVVLRSEEEEKHALFNELHENICQTFAAAKIYVSNYLNQGGPENLIKANELMTAGIESTRALAAVHLFPDLKLQTFVEAIRIFFMELNKSGSTHFTLDSRSFRGRDLPLQVKIMLYRIIQELTTRIIQKAGAGKASMKLMLKSSKLKLELKHNGSNTGEAYLFEGRTYEHLQMRLDQLGGSISILPEPEKGCLVTIELDLLKHDGFSPPKEQSVAED